MQGESGVRAKSYNKTLKLIKGGLRGREVRVQIGLNRLLENVGVVLVTRNSWAKGENTYCLKHLVVARIIKRKNLQTEARVAVVQDGRFREKPE